MLSSLSGGWSARSRRSAMHGRPEFATPFRTLTGVVLFLAAVAAAPAQTPESAVPNRPLRLAECLAINHQRQPSLVVARARLAAAQTKVAALEGLSGPTSLLHPALPERRQQAR